MLGCPARAAAIAGSPGTSSPGRGRPRRAEACPFIDHQRQTAAVREVGERRRFHRRHEPRKAEVARVDLQQESGLRSDGALVVGEPRAVRRADFDDPGARGGEDFGDAERSADLDQLAARDDDLAPGRQRGERQQQRRGAVVRHPRRLGAGERQQQTFEAAGAIAAAAGGEVELEVAGGGRKLAEPLGDLGGERRASEVGVQEDPGAVQYPAKRSSEALFEAPLQPLGQEGEPLRKLRRADAAGGELLPELRQLDAHLGGEGARSV